MKFEHIWVKFLETPPSQIGGFLKNLETPQANSEIDFEKFGTPPKHLEIFDLWGGVWNDMGGILIDGNKK